MKRISQIIRTQLIYFALIVSALVIGNLLGYLLLRDQIARLSADMQSLENTLVQKLETLERDDRYQKATIEQAQKERESLERALKFHQELMMRAHQEQSLDVTTGAAAKKN